MSYNVGCRGPWTEMAPLLSDSCTLPGRVDGLSYNMGCRGPWIEIAPLLSGSCTLPGRVDRPTLVFIHLLNLSRAGSKRHTLVNRLSWRAEPREGVVFTLHHWADELLNAANGQGGGGPRDPTAKCIPSQGQLVG